MSTYPPSSMPHPSSGYYPPHHNYQPYYNMPHGGRGYSGYSHHPGMMPPPSHAMGRGMPSGQPGGYPQNMHMGMYGPSPPSNYLNQYEEQLFNEALNLLNQMKTSGNEGENIERKNRLNYILSNNPKVHQKLKESLPQKS